MGIRKSFKVMEVLEPSRRFTSVKEASTVTIVEGDAIGDKVEKISYEIKLVASPSGGSIIKSTSHYHCKGEVEIKEERVKARKERAAGLFKIVENNLLGNPDAYN
ncbi:major strawberry allergen Fra a 1.07 [Rosa chinensis]|uniref:major strawberry allergen Fra a 1.07 n=1 Tax=Rosa chinensis TaxID=74649 RepID=UPI000D094902|nr:major strawberry allergen Fra a 1.07 [Rosa chinensis]